MERMDTGGHYDVEMKGWMQKKGGCGNDRVDVLSGAN